MKLQTKRRMLYVYTRIHERIPSLFVRFGQIPPNGTSILLLPRLHVSTGYNWQQRLARRTLTCNILSTCTATGTDSTRERGNGCFRTRDKIVSLSRHNLRRYLRWYIANETTLCLLLESNHFLLRVESVPVAVHTTLSGALKFPHSVQSCAKHILVNPGIYIVQKPQLPFQILIYYDYICMWF